MYLQDSDSATFKPSSDPDRPALGAVEVIDGTEYRVAHVEACSASAMLKEIRAGGKPVLMAQGAYDLCLSREHVSRPFVMWLVWFEKVSKKG